MSRTSQTAVIMLDVLTEATALYSEDLRYEIELRGGDPAYLGSAAKWLRDRGIPVATDKRRHLSTWWIDGDKTYYAEYVKRVMQEAYSEALSVARSTAGIPGARAVRSATVAYAVVIGERLGFSAEEVVEACKPYPMPAH